jgi:hypothetical protein
MIGKSKNYDYHEALNKPIEESLEMLVRLFYRLGRYYRGHRLAEFFTDLNSNLSFLVFNSLFCVI